MNEGASGSVRMAMTRFVMKGSLLAGAALVLLASGCDGCGESSTTPGGPSASASGVGSGQVAPGEQAPLKAPERTSGALMRSADGQRLYLADEDHKTIRVLALPLAKEPEPLEGQKPPPAPSASASAGPPRERRMPSFQELSKPPPPRPPLPKPPMASSVAVASPGAPAHVLPLAGKVLVTVRDPGLLLVMKEAADNKLEEEARIALAADAWGIAITPDEKTAIVTSAWTHTVTGIDLDTNKVRWTADVAREPRGIVVHPNGKTAYVSHLTSGDLTRIDGLDTDKPAIKTVSFPAAPSRTPLAHPLKGSLGYALVIDDAGNRLLAARHALGALGDRSWFGVATVDVLQTQDDTPLLGPRHVERRIATTPAFEESRAFHLEHNNEGWRAYLADQFRSAEMSVPSVAQPRAMALGRKSKTVWVAYEGDDSVGQYALYSAAPMERGGRVTQVGSHYKDQSIVTAYDGIPGQCGAPTGLAFSADESLLYVYCRSTNDIATIRVAPLKGHGGRGDSPTTVTARIVDEPLDTALSRGRRLFYGSRDGYTSGGLGCAGCHPEGRDDGHVWHEVFREDKTFGDEGVFLASEMLERKTKEGRLGVPRQTPMLAGRLNAKGPFGWKAQNENIRARLAEGFERHRWSSSKVDPEHWQTGVRYVALKEFLEKGLVNPPRPAELSEKALRGKEIFESPQAQCTVCHVPDSDYTDRAVYPMKAAPPPGFEEEEEMEFRTPSLLFIGGTPPYFHDGSEPTLASLIRNNRDRMGKTSHLSPDDQAALVAYLETL